MCKSCLEKLEASFKPQLKLPNVHLNPGECIIECPQDRQKHKLKLNEVPTCRLMISMIELYKAQPSDYNKEDVQNKNICSSNSSL